MITDIKGFKASDVYSRSICNQYSFFDYNILFVNCDNLREFSKKEIGIGRTHGRDYHLIISSFESGLLTNIFINNCQKYSFDNYLRVNTRPRQVALVSYYELHNVYFNGVKITDDYAPTSLSIANEKTSKLEVEIADLKRDFSLIMSLVKSQKEELNALKSAMVSREDDNKRLTDELKYKDTKIDNLERTFAIYYTTAQSTV